MRYFGCGLVLLIIYPRSPLVSLHRERPAPEVCVDPGDGAAHGPQAGAGRHEPLSLLRRHVSRVQGQERHVGGSPHPAPGLSDQPAGAGWADQPDDGHGGAQCGALHHPHPRNWRLPCLQRPPHEPQLLHCQVEVTMTVLQYCRCWTFVMLSFVLNCSKCKVSFPWKSTCISLRWF